MSLGQSPDASPVLPDPELWVLAPHGAASLLTHSTAYVTFALQIFFYTDISISYSPVSH